MTLMTVDLAPIWHALRPLLTEHGFLTILCAFLAVMMTISFYRFLCSVNPGLVGFVLLMVLFLLVLHWSQTRTEPALLKPAMDWVAQYIQPATPTHRP